MEPKLPQPPNHWQVISGQNHEAKYIPPIGRGEQHSLAVLLRRSGLFIYARAVSAASLQIWAIWRAIVSTLYCAKTTARPVRPIA
jgi:hypothetical protein